jgi:3-oxoacyl-[acyl-carrier-protein] synthase II
MERRRVVITGMGCLSPLGNDVVSSWQGALAGRSGAGPITHFDPSTFETHFAAEVKGFDGEAALGRRLARRTDRFTQFAQVSAEQALADSGLQVSDANRDRIGVTLGTGIGGVATLVNEDERYLAQGPRRVSPHTVPMMLPDAAAGQLAIAFGLRGPNMAVVTACASSSNAIGEATEMIRHNRADAMLAGGSEAAIVPVAVAGFNAMGAVSRRNDDPAGASRPFDLHRDGFVIGEGAAVLVLEELGFARARGARILAELVGYGTTNDAFHISAPAENGAGAAACMQLALKDAGLQHTQIDYINAHGTSTKLNDASETAAIKTVFGEAARSVPISSTKSMTGHLMGAAGALEAVFSIQALRESIVPPTINLQTPDPDCDLDYVPHTARKLALRFILSNSFGFGGHNASLIFAHPDAGGQG